MANKRSPAKRRSEQLLLRLTSNEMNVLDAAANLNRRTPNAYAYALLQAHIERLRNDEFVQRHLETRIEYEAAGASSEVVSMRQVREPSAGDDGADDRRRVSGEARRDEV